MIGTVNANAIATERVISRVRRASRENVIGSQTDVTGTSDVRGTTGENAMIGSPEIGLHTRVAMPRMKDMMASCLDGGLLWRADTQVQLMDSFHHHLGMAREDMAELQEKPFVFVFVFVLDLVFESRIAGA
jgi:hypothetical protein